MSDADPNDIPLAPAPPREPPPRPMFLAALTAPISFDLPCAKCGYNLYSLPRNGRCPECGRPISESLSGPLGELVHRGWIWAMAWGAAILAAAELAYGGLLLVGFFRPWLVAEYGLYGIATAAVLHGAGVWLLTVGEPEARPDPGLRRRRINARIGEAGAAALQLLLIAAPNEYLFALALAGASIASLLLGFYLHLLAKRIPNDSLSVTALNGGWATMIILAFLAAAVPITPAFVGLLFFACFIPIIALFPVAVLLRLAVPVLFARDLITAAWYANRDTAA